MIHPAVLLKKPLVPSHYSIFEVGNYFSLTFLTPKRLSSFSPPLTTMKRRLCCCFLMPILLQMVLSLCAATSRPFATLDEPPQQEKKLHFRQSAFESKQGMRMYVHGGVTDRGLSRLGSRPPNCEHKCQGCIPCDAIQIPANTDKKGLLYANYEPEGWKCKCGTAFFNP